MSKKRKGLGAEFPQGDLLQVVLAVFFFVVWVLDSFIYQLSIFLAVFIPLAVRLILVAVSLGLAFLLLRLSHQLLFEKMRDPPTIIDKGVYARVRHPMYLGTLLMYVAFILATFSLLSSAIWIGIFCIYNKMTTYEEEDLIRIFGDAYVNYQQQVPKWLPRIFPRNK